MNNDSAYKAPDMSIEAEGPYDLTANAKIIKENLKEYDLFENALELDLYGVTVVPPEKAGLSEEFVDQLRSTVIDIAARRNNVDLSGDYKTLEVDPSLMTIGNHWHTIYESDIVAETAVNPIGLALARYLLGNSCVLGLDAYFVKPGNCEAAFSLPLHIDYADPPGQRTASGANVAMILTDYVDDADGPTVFVPGSHKFSRPPFPHEEIVESCPFPVKPLRAKAGSIVAWHGSMWHGSLPRTKKGLRVHTINMYYRRNILPAHLWNEPEADELVKRIPGLDRLLAKGEYRRPFPTDENLPAETYDFIMMGRDMYM